MINAWHGVRPIDAVSAMPGQRSAAAAASEPLPKQDSPVPTEMQGPPNYVSCFIGSLKSVFVPLVRGLQQLPPVLQAPILVALLLFSIIPVLWGLFVLPPALLIVAAVYSYNYGYQTFVRHFETAMREHFEISEEVSSPRAHQLSSRPRVSKRCRRMRERSGRVPSTSNHRSAARHPMPFSSPSTLPSSTL